MLRWFEKSVVSIWSLEKAVVTIWRREKSWCTSPLSILTTIPLLLWEWDCMFFIHLWKCRIRDFKKIPPSGSIFLFWIWCPRPIGVRMANTPIFPPNLAQNIKNERHHNINFSTPIDNDFMSSHKQFQSKSSKNGWVMAKIRMPN